MKKVFRGLTTAVLEGNAWKKLVDPSVTRGLTAYPRKPTDQQRLGVRFDYDGEITIDDIVYHKYQMQPNAGDDIPATIKNWRDANGGTHAVMANVYVKKNGTKEDVEEALKGIFDSVQGV
ncbi:hypothetical protein BD311DRAFT_810653 [Dichomitus squalens]|uniref:Uncharacterized protein n=1 Tax=Dichomitus squalens TaxID=114155 RepID=A0A4Q9MBE5_9APHY|nr:hypothetical protein BD311DRAFT_810653 [Dichomitus squalens]